MGKHKHTPPPVRKTHFVMLKEAVRKKFTVKPTENSERSRKKAYEQTCKKLEWWWTKFHAARRRRVWKQSEQQNHRCCYCSRATWVYDGKINKDVKFVPDRLPGMSMREMATADHFVATSSGGTERPDNMVMCCERCNTLRGNMNANEFWKALQDPERIRGMIRRRGLLKAERTVVRKEKRQVSYDRVVLWFGYLFLISPHVRSIFDEVVVFLEHEYAKQDAPRLKKLATYSDLTDLAA